MMRKNLNMTCYCVIKKKTVQQLQADLPFDTILKCTFLNSMKRNHSGSFEEMSNVTTNVCNFLSNLPRQCFQRMLKSLRKFAMLFKPNGDSITESISESAYVCAIVNVATQMQSSPWEKAFKIAEVSTHNAPCNVTLDTKMCATYFQNIVSSDGKVKYSFLS